MQYSRTPSEFNPFMIPPLLRTDPQPKRKVFVSYHHQDECYRREFDRLFAEHFISASVDPGDINPDNQDEYVKRLIQEENIVQSSVVFALSGLAGSFYGAGSTLAGCLNFGIHLRQRAW
jgi:hypothetical protein